MFHFKNIFRYIRTLAINSWIDWEQTTSTLLKPVKKGYVKISIGKYYITTHAEISYLSNSFSGLDYGV